MVRSVTGSLYTAGKMSFSSTIQYALYFGCIIGVYVYYSDAYFIE